MTSGANYQVSPKYSTVKIDNFTTKLPTEKGKKYFIFFKRLQ